MRQEYQCAQHRSPSGSIAFRALVEWDRLLKLPGRVEDADLAAALHGPSLRVIDRVLAVAEARLHARRFKHFPAAPIWADQNDRVVGVGHL
jgi:hypothetical protein